MNPIRKCPVCGHHESEELYSLNIAAVASVFLPESYNIVACGKCGMCYADTPASQADYDRYYSECNNYAGIQSSREEYNALHSAINEELQNLISKEASIVDIGFGKGKFLEYLRDSGYNNIFGIDPSQYSVNQLREKGIDAIVGSIYDIGKLERRYDVAYLGGVIEHLLFPNYAVETLSEIVRDEGIIILAYPDFSDMSDDNFDIASNFNQEHINYFSNETIDHLCMINGFERIVSKRFVSFHSPGSTQYGVIGFYRKTNREHTRWVYDSKTAVSIKDYLNRLEIVEDETRKTIEKYVISGKGVSVWGTGQYALRLLATTSLLECNIDYFIDTNPTKIGRKFAGKTVVGPDVLRTYLGDVLVCSRIYADEIAKSITAINSSIAVIKL